MCFWATRFGNCFFEKCWVWLSKPEARCRNSTGETISTSHRRFYAYLSPSLKRVYIRSTDLLLMYRKYYHRFQNRDVSEILSASDCIETQFAWVLKRDIAMCYDTIKAHLEYYFVNTMQLKKGWQFVNDKNIRPDIRWTNFYRIFPYTFVIWIR